MISGVDHDRVAARQDRPEGAEVRLVPGREHQGGFGAQPVRELILQLDVEVDRPVQET